MSIVISTIERGTLSPWRCVEHNRQMPGDDPEGLDGAPRGLCATEILVKGERFTVLSYPLAEADIDAEGVLTTAERGVAKLAARGLANSEIARRRGTSVRTVANQMAAILRKLGCDSRRELAARHPARVDDEGS